MQISFKFSSSKIILDNIYSLILKFKRTDIRRQFSKQERNLYLALHAYSLSHVSLCVTPWTVVHEAPLSMRFFRQEYWSALPFPPPGDLPHPGTKATSPASTPADSLLLSH